jgi:acetyl esterase/lipase
MKLLYMKPQFLIIISVLIVLSSSSLAQKLADPILLWPNGAPGATGTSDEDKPAIIPFIPDVANRTGAAILVVPGGGFTIRAVDHEGVLVAQWLRKQGITAFVLRYRLRPLYDRKDWVEDGKRAIQYIRAHASEYHISPEHIGAVGFSAGASLIPDMTLNAANADNNSTDPLSHYSSKPNFMILAYGSMRVAEMPDSLVRKSFPPTFLYGTVEDRGSQSGMIDMYSRLFRAGVPVEAHFFQNGIHGTGFALGDPVLGEWTHLLSNWLKGAGVLTNKTQIAMGGIVKLDGNPLLKGMVILTPINDPQAPPVIIYMNNTGTGELGRFMVPQNQGPVEGKYKVEVRQDATRWTSNSRDPFMIQMMDRQSKGSLTEADRMEWGGFLRKRNLSPSIYDQRIYSHRRPGDKTDYSIDIRAGEEVMIEVFSK